MVILLTLRLLYICDEQIEIGCIEKGFMSVGIRFFPCRM